MATLAELRAEAKRQKRKGYSKLKKAELEKLLETPPPKPPRGVPRKKPASQSVPVVQPAKKASSTRKSQIEEIEALLKKNPIKLSKEEKDLIKPPAKKAPAKKAPAKKAPAKKTERGVVEIDGVKYYDKLAAKKIFKPMLNPQTIKREVQDLIAKKGLSPKEAMERVAEAEKKMIDTFWKKAYGKFGHITMELSLHERDWEKWSEKNLAKFFK